MKTETLHKLIESNLEWLYDHMGKYHVEDPQDSVHEIVVKILEKPELYAKAPEDLPVSEFRKWFSAYVYWQFRQEQRDSIARWNNVVFFDEMKEDIPVMWADKEKLEVEHDLDNAFRQFPEPFRSQLRAVLEGDMTFEQLAEKTGEPLSTVSTRIYRARTKLQKSLAAYSTKSPKEARKNSTKSRSI